MIQNIIVFIIVAAAVIYFFILMIKKIRKGNSCCSGKFIDCTNCHHDGCYNCPFKKKNNNKINKPL